MEQGFIVVILWFTSGSFLGVLALFPRFFWLAILETFGRTLRPAP